MAARVAKIRHDEQTRAKIQAAQIINRFHKCLMGEVVLDAQQVSCGKALLNKALPDLASVALTDPSFTGPAQVLFKTVYEQHRD